jgi:glycosyltransferase involved in cell wall biosynthesis
MSRELFGIGVFALLCILLVPFYSQTKFMELQEKKKLQLFSQPDTVKADRKKSIVLITPSFVPKTFAGSEISNFENLKYLQARGHSVVVYVKQWVVPEYKGIPLKKFDPSDEQFKQDILSCDVLFNAMFDNKEAIQAINERKKPVFLFVHVVDNEPWVQQQKMPFPITIVYNSQMTHDGQQTIHPNFIMYPYVNTKVFKQFRSTTIRNSTVCLINCNRNKGGDVLVQLAKTMPNTQFLGVKGAYSKQIVEEGLPNLTYMETQEDITTVIPKIGILIMPSHHETWGRTAVEAMAAGIPVIHSEAGGLVECVAGAGIMCLQDDLAAWATAIERINRDPAYREQLRQRGFKRVEELERAQTLSRQELARRVESP